MGHQRDRLRRALRQAEKDFTAQYVEIPKDKWPAHSRVPFGLTRVFRNNHFIVEVYDSHTDPFTGKPSTKVMARHNSGKPIVQWADLQDMKNQIFGVEVLAVQYLPPESKLIDEANMFWFFVVQG